MEELEPDKVDTTEERDPGTALLSDTGITNFTKAEQIMIGWLVGRDQIAREFVSNQLEEWFQALCERYPADTQGPDTGPLLEMKNNFGRIWTTLLYSVFKVNDEANVQTLSTTICDYLTAISTNPKVLSIFTERFFVVLIREWTWIHPLMETHPGKVTPRIFIRTFLKTLPRYDWRDEYVDPFLNILEVHLFNSHPPPPRSTRSASKAPVPLQAPIELQIHFIRVILEEVGDIASSGPDNSKLLKLLSFFVNQLIRNKNTDVANEINQCLQQHIVKKSETISMDRLGTTLQEIELSDKAIEENPCLTGDNPMKSEAEASNDNDVQIGNSINATQPPRLNFDYGQIIVQLKEANQKSGSGNKANHSAMQDLLKQIEAVQPPTVVVDPKSVIPENPVASVHSEIKTPPTSSQPVDLGRKRKGKVRQQKLTLLKVTTITPTTDRTNWNSKYLNDPEFLDHICDNYMSYLVEMTRTPPLPKSSSQSNSVDSQPSSHNGSNDSEHQYVKRRRLEFDPPASMDSNPEEQTLSTSVEVGSGATTSQDVHNQSTENLMTRKRRKDDSVTSHNASALEDDVTPKRMRLVRNGLGCNVAAAPQYSCPGVTPVASTVPTGSSSNSTPIILTPTPFPKGVRFVLASNLEHEHKDYPKSIEESPAVPYDGERLPSSGLLKRSVHWKKKAAADFARL